MTLSNLADMLPEMAGAYIDRMVVNGPGSKTGTISALPGGKGKHLRRPYDF
jgi:hypothetical protein